MMHWRARRLLACLPDQTLAEDVELQVRLHVASCARCRHAVEELELAEELLLRMPTALVPLDGTPASYRRLASLARWSQEPERPGPDRWSTPILSLASALAIFTFALMVGRYSPLPVDATISISLAMYQPDVVYLPPPIN